MSILENIGIGHTLAQLCHGYQEKDVNLNHGYQKMEQIMELKSKIETDFIHYLYTSYRLIQFYDTLLHRPCGFKNQLFINKKRSLYDLNSFMNYLEINFIN